VNRVRDGSNLYYKGIFITLHMVVQFLLRQTVLEFIHRKRPRNARQYTNAMAKLAKPGKKTENNNPAQAQVRGKLSTRQRRRKTGLALGSFKKSSQIGLRCSLVGEGESGKGAGERRQKVMLNVAVVEHPQIRRSPNCRIEGGHIGGNSVKSAVRLRVMLRSTS
jgi:hypothetical protein